MEKSLLVIYCDSKADLELVVPRVANTILGPMVVLFHNIPKMELFDFSYFQSMQGNPWSFKLDPNTQ